MSLLQYPNESEVQDQAFLSACSDLGHLLVVVARGQ